MKVDCQSLVDACTLMKAVQPRPGIAASEFVELFCDTNNSRLQLSLSGALSVIATLVATDLPRNPWKTWVRRDVLFAFIRAGGKYVGFDFDPGSKVLTTRLGKRKCVVNYIEGNQPQGYAQIQNLGKPVTFDGDLIEVIQAAASYASQNPMHPHLCAVIAESQVVYAIDKSIGAVMYRTKSKTDVTVPIEIALLQKPSDEILMSKKGVLLKRVFDSGSASLLKPLSALDDKFPIKSSNQAFIVAHQLQPTFKFEKASILARVVEEVLKSTVQDDFDAKLEVTGTGDGCYFKLAHSQGHVIHTLGGKSGHRGKGDRWPAGESFSVVPKNVLPFLSWAKDRPLAVKLGQDSYQGFVFLTVDKDVFVHATKPGKESSKAK